MALCKNRIGAPKKKVPNVLPTEGVARMTASNGVRKADIEKNHHDVKVKREEEKAQFKEMVAERDEMERKDKEWEEEQAVREEKLKIKEEKEDGDWKP